MEMAVEDLPPPVDEELLMLQRKSECVSAELNKLKQMLDVLVNVQSQNVREAKIIELLKKNLALAKHMERERNLSSRLKKDVIYLQQELGNIKEAKTDAKDPQKVAQESNIWKEKYNQALDLTCTMAQAKLLEAQGAKSVLSAEIARLHQALQREVGNISISKVLQEGQFWKGRAQQISLLKDKISELEARVREAARDECGGRDFDTTENACKKQLDELAQNFLATKEELVKIKKKVDCVIARRNILETEMNNTKEKMGLLMCKSDNDDRLIAALRQEVESSKQAVAADTLNQRVSCPLRNGSLHREHQLAASFNDLKLHCREQELQIKAQVELLHYLRDITASSGGEEEQ